MDEVIIGFDIGTTHLKWQVASLERDAIYDQGVSSAHRLSSGERSEQNPVAIADDIEALLDTLTRRFAVRRISFSAAMHSLMAVNAAGCPLTPSLTWMDARAVGEAQALRSQPEAQLLRRTTGVPIHASSPLVKWLHLRKELPADARPIALKDYVLYRLTGEWLQDYSIASASGFLGLNHQYSLDAVQLAHLTPDRLPSLHSMAWEVPERQGRFTVRIGGNDAAMAHRHLRIPPDGSIAVLSMGTSGSLRTTFPQALYHPDLFCYTMGPKEGFLVGSAFSNVGSLLVWLSQIFAVPVDHLLKDALHTVYSNDPLPLVIPYLYGERSPWWNESLDAEWRHLLPQHGQRHLAAATLVSIAAGYWQGLLTLERVGQPMVEIRAGSGLIESPGMAQFFADALNRPIVLFDEQDASLVGALDLAKDPLPSPRMPKSSTRYSPHDGGVLHQRVRNTAQMVRETMSEP